SAAAPTENSTVAKNARKAVDGLLRGGEPLAEEFAARLATLPDQDRPRPDPVFTLRAFRRPAKGEPAEG
ncbi:hypothetical protein ABZ651_22995, partial [Streptomyces sp. NPDC007070]